MEDKVISGTTHTVPPGARPQAHTPKGDDAAQEAPTSPLLRLIEHGQSYWLDNLTRRMLRNGELARRVREEGLRGLTSNPAIFHAAITGDDEYDAQIERLARTGHSAVQIYEALVVEDIQGACDLLRPVYDESQGVDGYVSLEVSPYLAHDTAGSIREACRLWACVDRPNLYIKIPGTPAGVPAIEELLYRGINVNVTLLFSIAAYETVAMAYLRALEHRRSEGKPIDSVSSVASFFLSRIDVLVDRLLAARTRPSDTGDGLRPEALLGKAAVANAKLAYQSFLFLIAEERWKSLEAAGARPQRLLWASTSTKDPLYDAIMYVEPLIGPHTVNTMPEVTIETFAARGRVLDHSVAQGAQAAGADLEALAAVGIDFGAVTEQLLNEGVAKFIAPYDKLLATLEAHRLRAPASPVARSSLAPGGQAAAVDKLVAALGIRRLGGRLGARDPLLWSADADVGTQISNRLGWLDGADAAQRMLGEILPFAASVRDAGTTHVVLLGMGGSSLCPTVAARTFGSAPGWPELIVLDDTDPAAVREVGSRIDLAHALFLVASKSGGTVETMSLYRHFFGLVSASGEPQPGERFVALTDAGTPLADEARKRNFLHLFETPADVGGRYSALTHFGLLPMALIGVDVEAVLASVREMERACDPELVVSVNPALSLGAALGELARRGRDKVTFVADPGIEAFPMWVEQLLAESTGKEGRGLVPVVGEPPAAAEEYGADRAFVHLTLADAGNASGTGGNGTLVDRLEALGHPVARIAIPGLAALGGEFLRWEIATAAAGVVLGINPFDEPNVAESKRNTAALLEEWKQSGRFEEERAGEPGTPANGRTADTLREFCDLARPGDYVAVLAYFRSTPARARGLAELRSGLRALTGAATTLGYGPRYLHSTGQLHKGGPNRGLFLVLTADADGELAIPGEDFGFATLHRAQALGDLRSLRDHGRRAHRVHLGANIEGGLEEMVAALR